MLIFSLLAALGLAMPVPVSVPAAGPVPEHHVFALLRDYFPSSSVSIKQGESIRFVDADPTAGPGHTLTETVPEGVTPKFDSDVVPPGTFRDVPNVESQPHGTYRFNCKIHNSLKGTLTVG